MCNIEFECVEFCGAHGWMRKRKVVGMKKKDKSEGSGKSSMADRNHKGTHLRGTQEPFF